MTTTFERLGAILSKEFKLAPERLAPELAEHAAPAWLYLHGLKSPLSSTALRAIRKGA